VAWITESVNPLVFDDLELPVVAEQRFLTLAEVLKVTGWSRAGAYRRLDRRKEGSQIASQYREVANKNGVTERTHSQEDLKRVYPEFPWEPGKVVEMPLEEGSFSDQLARLDEKGREQAVQRLRVITPLLRAGIGDGNRISAPVLAGAAHRSAGRTALLKKVAKEEGIAWRTVYGWVERFHGDTRGKYAGLSGIVALADRSRADKGCGRVNPAGQSYIRRLVLDGSHATQRGLHRRYEAHRLWCEKNAGFRIFDPRAQDEIREWLDDELRLSREAIPTKLCYDTFRRYADAIPRGQVDLARGEHDKHKNTQVPFIYRRYEMDPMEFVVMDHRQADVMCAVWDHKGARLIRPWMTCALDMRTRRWLAWVLVETPSSHSITTVVRMLIEKFGRPKNFYWDNGGDFECAWVEGLMTGLGCNVTHALPGLARSKPIEPNFRRVSIWERNFKTWTGHRTDVRPERLERKEAAFKQWKRTGKGDCPFPTLDELRQTYGVVFDEINARPLRGTGMGVMAPQGKRWLSPLESWERQASAVAFERVPLSALLSLLRDQRERKVRHGQIRMMFHGVEAIYIPTPEYPSAALADLNGKTVDVAVDPLDLGKVVVYYRGDLVCVCQNLELRGMGEAAFREGMKIQRRITKVQREEQRLVAAQGALDPVANARRALEIAGAFVEPQRKEVALLFAEHERAAAALGGGRVSTAAAPEIESWEVKHAEQGDEFVWFSDNSGGGE
jgi:hypothetical protein